MITCTMTNTAISSTHTPMVDPMMMFTSDLSTVPLSMLLGDGSDGSGIGAACVHVHVYSDICTC